MDNSTMDWNDCMRCWPFVRCNLSTVESVHKNCYSDECAAVHSDGGAVAGGAAAAADGIAWDYNWHCTQCCCSVWQ